MARTKKRIEQDLALTTRPSSEDSCVHIQKDVIRLANLHGFQCLDRWTEATEFAENPHDYREKLRALAEDALQFITKNM
jgi:hypothetical protein